MRGKGQLTTCFLALCRITPAYAGKSVGIDTRQKCIQDHPRLCGEKPEYASSPIPNVGSPPPMRGKVNVQASIYHFRRITPAYAGKSSNFYLVRTQPQDHPRLCGEKTLIFRQIRLYVGSPPPMRGKADRSYNKYKMYGITPAYAGKSFEFLKKKCLPRDHPRLCGEKVKTNGKSATEKGSPPPMRGKGSCNDLI